MRNTVIGTFFAASVILAAHQASSQCAHCVIQTKAPSASVPGQFDYRVSCIVDISGDEVNTVVTAATDDEARVAPDDKARAATDGGTGAATGEGDGATDELVQAATDDVGNRAATDDRSQEVADDRGRAATDDDRAPPPVRPKDLRVAQPQIPGTGEERPWRRRGRKGAIVHRDAAPISAWRIRSVARSMIATVAMMSSSTALISE